MSLRRYCRDKRSVVLTPKASAYQAARAMLDNHVGTIIVEDAGVVVGIVTDRTLALRVIGLDLPPMKTRLHEIMSPDPVTLSVDDTEEQAAQLMKARHIRRIPLLEGDRLAGIVTLDDLILTGVVDPETAATIVAAQLNEPARLKLPATPFPTESRGGASGDRPASTR